MKLTFFLSIIFVFFCCFLLPIITKAQPTPQYRFFKIVDKEENPVMDAKVEIFSKGKPGTSPIQTLETDKDGNILNYRINGLINKGYGYNIKISKPGYIPTILILSDTNIEDVTNESSPVAYQDLSIFENINDCLNCYNLLMETENLWNPGDPRTPKPMKIKLLPLPATKIEWEIFAQEQKNQKLISAIVKDDTLTVKNLLQLGTDPNTKSRHDIPAIVWATVHGNKSILEALLEAGANVNNKNSLAQKTLFYYIQFRHMNNLSSEIDVKLVEKLIKAGANVNASNRYGSTALNFTSSKLFNNKDVTKLLKQNGAVYSDALLKIMRANKRTKTHNKVKRLK